MTRPERVVLDLGDPERLAEALVLGAVDQMVVTPAQLRKLGQAHTEVLARVRKLGDDAQVAVGELEELRTDLASAKRVNAELRALIATGKLADPPAPGSLGEMDAIELVIDSAAVLVGLERLIGVLVNATANSCLRAAKPLVAAQIAACAFERLVYALAQLYPPARQAGAPS